MKEESLVFGNLPCGQVQRWTGVSLWCWNRWKSMRQCEIILGMEILGDCVYNLGEKKELEAFGGKIVLGIVFRNI